MAKPLPAVEIWKFIINVVLYLSGTVLVLSSNAGREEKRHSQKRLWTTAECGKDPSSTSFGFDDGTHVVKRRSALAAPAA